MQLRKATLENPAPRNSSLVQANSWLGARLHRLKTGLDPALQWWNGLAHEYKPGNRSGRSLTPEQAGILIALLEAVRPLESRSNDSVMGARQLDWLILQRSQALVGMEGLQSAKWQPDPHPERPGWYVYTWEAQDQKGKRVIKLSLPKTALQILQRVSNNFEKTIGTTSRWAFPQINNKYFMRAKFETNGSIGELDKHITNSSMYQMLSALGGRRKGWPNLLRLVGLPDLIGSHDLRRTVTDHFENMGLGAYASALLDHKVTGVDKMDQQIAALTQKTYSAAHRVNFKAEGLQLWLSVVIPAYEKAKSDPRIAEAVKARKESLERSQAAGSEKRRQTRAANRSSGAKKRRGRGVPESINSDLIFADRRGDGAPDRTDANIGVTAVPTNSDGLIIIFVWPLSEAYVASTS
jgi:integrase